MHTFTSILAQCKHFWQLFLFHLLSGLVSEPTRQMEEAQEDHQRVSRSRHFAAHSPRPIAVPLRRGGRGSHGRQPVLFSR